MHQTWKTPTPYAPPATLTEKPDIHQLSGPHCLLLHYFPVPSPSAMVHRQGQEQGLLVRKSPLMPSASPHRPAGACSVDHLSVRWAGVSMTITCEYLLSPSKQCSLG